MKKPENVLLDTDTLSYILRGKPAIVLRNYEAHMEEADNVFISRITVYEILNGLKAVDAHAQLARFRQFLAEHEVLELTDVAVEIASDFYAALKKQGRHSNTNDLLIAGIALTNKLTLVTNNTKDYEHLEGLHLENWALELST